MKRARPAPTQPALHEAVAILSQWSARVGADEIVARCCPYPVLEALKGGQPVGSLRWREGSRWWWVVVGMGSWRVTPESRDWNAKMLDDEARVAERGRYRWRVEPVVTNNKPVDPDQEVLRV